MQPAPNFLLIRAAIFFCERSYGHAAQRETTPHAKSGHNEKQTSKMGLFCTNYGVLDKKNTYYPLAFACRTWLYCSLIPYV